MVAALVGVLVLSACATTHVKDFRKDANAICAAAAKQLHDLPRPSSPAEVAEVTKRQIAAREEALRYLTELTVPIEIEGATAVFEHLELQVERGHAIEKAAKRVEKEAKPKDEHELRKLQEEDRKELELEAAHAREVGLDDCAEL